MFLRGLAGTLIGDLTCKISAYHESVLETDNNEYLLKRTRDLYFLKLAHSSYLYYDYRSLVSVFLCCYLSPLAEREFYTMISSSYLITLLSSRCDADIYFELLRGDGKYSNVI